MRFIIALFLLVHLMSCKKEKDVTPLFAGESNADYIINSNANELQPTVVFGIQNTYGRGRTSLDLDSDGQTDLILEITSLNEDSFPFAGTPHLFDGWRIYFKYDVQIAGTRATTSIGTSFNMAAAFSAGDRIDTHEVWDDRSDIDDHTIGWTSGPGVQGASQESWFHINGIAYVGFKIGDRYGWLEIDGTVPDEPQFLSYALQP